MGVVNFSTLAHRARLLVLLSVVFATLHHAETARIRTQFDRKKAEEVWTKAAEPDTTQYGAPQVLVQSLPTSVDHFSKAQYTQNNTFDLRHIVVWPTIQPTSDSPIFLFCGQESPLTDISFGAYSDYANATDALQIWPEHRYYAEEAPYTPVDNLEHFTIEQALVDHIELVLYIQKSLNMTRNPVIAIGSSYSGQLASFLRMRYPDVIAGAIASSPTSLGAPGLGLDPSYDPYGFAKVATRTASSQAGAAPACTGNVQKFFQTIFQLGQSTSGLNQINQDMSLCSNSLVTSYSELNASLATWVQYKWIKAAQYNAPIADYGDLGIPANRVQVACELLSDSTLEGSTLLSAMVSATSVFSGNASVSRGCLDITRPAPEPESEPEPNGPAEAPAGEVAGLVPKAEGEASPSAVVKQSSRQDSATDAVFLLTSSDKFDYQVCNQDQTPTSFNGVSDMFFDSPYNLDAEDARCVRLYGIHAQFNWAAYNFGLSAIRQSSNIFFTNGIYDPFIACGPTKNISDTITAFVYEGCHAYDMGSATPEDPPSVTASREEGVRLIRQWVDEYNRAKATVPLSNAADLFELSYSLGGYTDVVPDLLGSQIPENQESLEPSSSLTNGQFALLG